MSHNCSMGSTLIGMLRILLGAAMIFFGASKLGLGPEVQEMIGNAGHLLGLTFLSKTTWFRIAVAGEILAGLLLLFGWKTKIGALLTLVIMVFARNSMGWVMDSTALNAMLVSVAALIVLIRGPGKWACDARSCCGTSCCDADKKDGCCGSGCCSQGHHHHQQQQ